MSTPLQNAEQNNIEIIEKGGHHTPNSQRYPDNCGCKPVTDGGNAYRDLITRFTNSNGHNVRRRYYHQSRVITKVTNQKQELQHIDVNTHGYGTSSTTRERINRELPPGIQLVQKDYTPMLKVGGDLIDVPQRFKIDYNELENGWITITTAPGLKTVVDVNREVLNR